MIAKMVSATNAPEAKICNASHSFFVLDQSEVVDLRRRHMISSLKIFKSLFLRGHCCYYFYYLRSVKFDSGTKGNRRYVIKSLSVLYCQDPDG